MKPYLAKFLSSRKKAELGHFSKSLLSNIEKTYVCWYNTSLNLQEHSADCLHNVVYVTFWDPFKICSWVEHESIFESHKLNHAKRFGNALIKMLWFDAPPCNVLLCLLGLWWEACARLTRLTIFMKKRATKLWKGLHMYSKLTRHHDVWKKTLQDMALYSEFNRNATVSTLVKIKIS